MLIVFDDMIADMIYNKKLNSVVTELFIRGRKLNISLVLITQSYFKAQKDVRLNTTHFFIMKIPNEREVQQIVLNHSSDIDFKGFIKIYKKCTEKPYSFLVNDVTLASDWEKQIKTIEDQGEKQIKAIQDQGHAKTIKKYDYDDEDSPFQSKKKYLIN